MHLCRIATLTRHHASARVSRRYRTCIDKWPNSIGASLAERLSPSDRRKDSKSSTHYCSPLPRNDPRGGARSRIKGRLLLFSASIQSSNWPESQTVSAADTSPQSPRPSGQHFQISERDRRDTGIQYGFSSIESVQEPCRFGSADMEKAISRHPKSQSFITYPF